jgi:uncharacterized membrane protein
LVREELLTVTKKSVFGLNENLAGLLSYALLFFSGVIVLIMEKENKTVRFHALQSILWFMLLWIARTVVGWIPLISGPLDAVIGLVTVASWLFLMYNAYMGKKFKIPMIGDVAEKQVDRIG